MKNLKYYSKQILFIIIFVCSLSSCSNSEETITLLERLNELEGVSAIQVETLPGFTECFQIDYTQPVDHDMSNGETFQQRFYLSNRNCTNPTVFYTTGYGVSRNSEKDITSTIQGNQVLLVHRYFPNAVPSSDWQFLTIRQAASDQHRIKEILKEIYPEKWISSGGSKGGMTALFYRYYFPEDVDATIAYVAPIMIETDDLRFADFLKNVGTEACRGKIKSFQRAVLSKREQIMPLLEAHIQTKGYEFSIISKEAAFEYSVMEYMFAFWQYGAESGCATIPSTEAELNDEELLFDTLIQVSPLSFYADNGFNYYEPLFYQAYTEIGYCTFVYSHLEDLLKTVKNPSYRSFAPVGIEMTFNPAIMKIVIPWLQTRGEKILYLYGEIDPWTAGAIVPDQGLDSLVIRQPGANHLIRIGNLDQSRLVIETLNRWLNLSINISSIKKTVINRSRSRF